MKGRLCLGALLVGIAATAGCGSIANSISQGAAEGAFERRDTLAAVTRPVVAAAVAQAGRTFGDSVRGELIATVDSLSRHVRDSLVNAVLDSIDAQVLRLDDSVAAFLSGPGSEAVQRLLEANLATVRTSVDEAIASWTATLAVSTEERLQPALEATVSAALGGALDTLAARIAPGSPLSNSIENLTERVLERALQTIQEDEGTQSGLRWVLIAGGAVVVSIVGIFLVFLIRGRRREARLDSALRILGTAIQEKEASHVAERVSNMAKAQGVEPWLNEYLRERRLLVEDEPPGGQPGASGPGGAAGP